MSMLASRSVSLDELLYAADLPALPQSAVKLMALSRGQEPSVAELAAVMDSDPGLTAQVLRFVDAPHFGFASEISNIKLALVLVGVRRVQNFTVWSAVFNLDSRPQSGAFCLTTLWHEARRRALFARLLVKAFERDGAEDAYSAALLQDMALPLLAAKLPGEYADMLSECQKATCRLSGLERERFGWTHAEAGGVMARQWGLPEDLACLIEGHVDESLDAGTSDHDFVQSVVRLSSLMPGREKSLDGSAFIQACDEFSGGSTLAVSGLVCEVDSLLGLTTLARQQATEITVCS